MARSRLSQRQTFIVLATLVVLTGVAKWLWPELVPVAGMTIPILIAGVRLPTRSVAVLIALGSLVLLFDIAVTPDGRTLIAAGVVVVIMVVAYRSAAQREAWGLGANEGMAILLRVRDELRAQGEPPDMMPGWRMTRAIRSSSGDAFRGDFSLAHAEGPLLQTMVVDVSGHGTVVAVHGQQLAGAFGGLIGVVPSAETLRACNDYLTRQRWDRDYATAVHAVVDQRTGVVELRTAGHPPAQVRRADGTWMEVTTAGPALGLVRGAAFAPSPVTLEAGDVLALVSDGALDQRSDEPWAEVHRAVEAWVAAACPDDCVGLLDRFGPSDDDQTIVLVARESTT